MDSTRVVMEPAEEQEIEKFEDAFVPAAVSPESQAEVFTDPIKTEVADSTENPISAADSITETTENITEITDGSTETPDTTTETTKSASGTLEKEDTANTTGAAEMRSSENFTETSATDKNESTTSESTPTGEDNVAEHGASEASATLAENVLPSWQALPEDKHAEENVASEQAVVEQVTAASSCDHLSDAGEGEAAASEGGKKTRTIGGEDKKSAAEAALDNPTTIPSTQEAFFGPEPIMVTCHICKTPVVTNVTEVMGRAFAAGMALSVLLMPVACIGCVPALILVACKPAHDLTHQCPRCRVTLGTWRRI